MLYFFVAPRPIGWITSLDPDGRVNLAPCSFFNAFSEGPPIVGFSSGGRKDTQRNIEATGEFVANLATRKHAEAMNLTSAPVPHGVNEMELAGLVAVPSHLVKPPRVADIPAALECKLLLILPLTDLEGKLTGNTLILGQVVGVHIDKALPPRGRSRGADTGPITQKLRACSRCCGRCTRPHEHDLRLAQLPNLAWSRMPLWY